MHLWINELHELPHLYKKYIVTSFSAILFSDTNFYAHWFSQKPNPSPYPGFNVKTAVIISGVVSELRGDND